MNIYFDNAATTLPKPKGVGEEMVRALNTMGNPARGAHGYALASLRLLAEARECICTMFNAPSPERVVFTSGATESLNIAINGISGHILTTAAEHNSVLRPLYKRGDFTILPLDKEGRLDIHEISSAIKSKKPSALVMTHASNLTGNVSDIESVGKLCKEHNIKLIVDAAQTGGLIGIDMSRFNISALALSGHKSLYGASGVGVLCLASGFTPSPLYVGGSGSDSFSKTQPSNLPDLLEAGTMNFVGIAALLAGIRYVKSESEKVFKDADSLARRFIKGLKGLKDSQKLEFYGDLDAKLRTPVVSFNIKGVDSALAAQILSEDYGIAVRSGGHCAPLMHNSLGTTGAIRFSFSHFNTEPEVDTAICAIADIISSN